MPIRSSREELVGACLGLAATAWIFLVAVWGIHGVFCDGHFGSQANIGTIGYNMNRYGTIYAYYPFLDHVPTPASAYLHHPLGVFWVEGLLIKFFGVYNWVLRIPAVVYVTATTFFLYRLGRAIWGPLEGALTAIGFAALPITLGFANFHDMEQPVMFGCVVATWGYARFRQTEREGYALASVVGFAFALINDWEAYIWGIALVGFVFVRAYVIPETWLGKFNPRRLGRYWALMAGTAIAVLSITAAIMISAGKVSDVLGMYQVRTAGSNAPLGLVLQARHVRIELMFTALGILLGKIAVPLFVIRFFARRNELEVLPLFLLFMAVFYYTVFKQGADIHIFWPHPFATYFGLSIGVLAATLRDVVAWLAPRLKPRWQRFISVDRAPWIALFVVALPVLLVFRDGASLIRLARETGGRFMEVHAQSDVDLNTALRWFLFRFPGETERVAFHSSIAGNWDTLWEARPHPAYPRQPIVAGPAPFAKVYMLDTRLTAVAELRDVAKRYHVHAVGSYWLMDRSAPYAPLDGYGFNEHDPGLLESLREGATEPIRQVTPDPWTSWEWRTLMGQPAVVPVGSPRTPEQLRIAHNISVSTGDAAAAARYRSALVGQLDIRGGARWNNGIELLGTKHHRGAARSLTPYLLVTKDAACATVMVRAKVSRRRFLSTLPIDPADPNIAYPPPIACDLWRAGQIYSVPVVYRHRAGREDFTLSLAAAAGRPAPVPLAGPAELRLLSL